MSEDEPTSSVPLRTSLHILSDTSRRRLLLTLLKHTSQERRDSQLPVDIILTKGNLEVGKTHMRHTHTSRNSRTQDSSSGIERPTRSNRVLNSTRSSHCSSSSNITKSTCRTI